MRSSLSQRCGVLLAVLLVGAGGCDAFQKLRAAFHPDEGDTPEFGKAGLRVEVQPPDGISILLDGRRVASVSPWINKRLTAGSHRLEVRAMGYFPVTLPVELADGEVLKVPVALRRRAGTEAIAADPDDGPSDFTPPEPPPAPAPTLPWPWR